MHMQHMEIVHMQHIEIAHAHAAHGDCTHAAQGDCTHAAHRDCTHAAHGDFTHAAHENCTHATQGDCTHAHIARMEHIWKLRTRSQVPDGHISFSIHQLNKIRKRSSYMTLLLFCCSDPLSIKIFSKAGGAVCKRPNTAQCTLSWWHTVLTTEHRSVCVEPVAHCAND